MKEDTKFKKGMIPWNKGKHGIMPIPWNKNKKGLHISKKTEFKKGAVPWNKGKKYLQITGKNHPQWRGGGISYYHKIANTVYREHALNPICEMCGSPDQVCIHHRDRNQKNNQIGNLQALCKPCHTKIHRRGAKKCKISF